MTSCEVRKCRFFKGGKCTDEEVYVSKRDGAEMCRYNSDAILLSEYEEENKCQ